MFKRWLNGAIAVFGVLSFLSFIGYGLALHDIWHDYASPEVWAHAGEPVPAWYPEWAGCKFEWRMLNIGGLPILIFHLLLFARFTVRLSAYWKKTAATPLGTRDWTQV